MLETIKTTWLGKTTRNLENKEQDRNNRKYIGNSK
jgi:hypothetical protein